MKKFTIKPSRDIIQISEFASSTVGEYEVKVQVKAVSLNYRDILNRQYSDKEIVPFSDGAGEFFRKMLELGL